MQSTKTVKLVTKFINHRLVIKIFVCIGVCTLCILIADLFELIPYVKELHWEFIWEVIAAGFVNEMH